MAQLFHPATTLIFRAFLAGLFIVLPLATGVGLASAWAYSDWYTRKDFDIPQPVPFSHEHHVKGLGLDCRFCHTTADQSSSAGIPSTKTCMTCHSQIWWHSPVLAPVRQSWGLTQAGSRGAPIHWNRVHDLPDYVYFDHSIHVNKGIGCSSCHGDVSRMPLIRRVANIQMRWCLECHREPERYVRPLNRIYDPEYQPPIDQIALGQRLLEQYHVSKSQLTNCSICHR